MDSSATPSGSNKVEMSKSALGLLVASLVVSLTLVAFLLGRESARPTTPPQPSSEDRRLATLDGGSLDRTEEVVEAGSIHRDTSQRPIPRPAEIQEPVVAPVATVAPVEAPSPGSRPVSPVPQAAPASQPVAVPQLPPDPAKVEQTRQYLAQIDGALAATPALSDPQSMATQLLGQSLSGDTSGFDALVREAQGALDRLKAISPPPHCQEHHRLHIEQLQAGIKLLGQVRNASQGDTSGLAQLSVQGHAMQAEIVRLQQLEAELRSSIR